MEKLDDYIRQFFAAILFPFIWVYIFFKPIFTSLKSRLTTCFSSKPSQSSKTNSKEDYRLGGGRKKK